MADIKTFKVDQKGQSVVEYLLLLVVIVSIGFSVYNSKPFKDFVGPNSSYFNHLKKGMEYSYRYGVSFDNNTDYETAMEYDYSNNQHPTYLNADEGISRFFTTVETPYGN